MTYRFAMSSFWGALAFANVTLPSPLTWGVIKGIQLRNVRYWANQPGAFSPSGDNTLTIGFNYPNAHMTENYNSPGSPYWCCKSFITLSLPPDHPFWFAAEEPYPSSTALQPIKVLAEPLHITVHAGIDGGRLTHTYLLSSGQQCSYPVKASAAKYGKYAYSSAFGFSVPTGNMTLEELGGDSTLALSEDPSGKENRLWKCRLETREARVEGDEKGEWKWLRSMWYPWTDVEVETWLVPPSPYASELSPLWHLRIHRIKTGRKLKAAEGGWAIYGQGSNGRALDLLPDDLTEGEFGYTESAGESIAASRAGVSGIVDLEPNGQREAKVIRTDPNSNLISARAVLPTLLCDYEPSENNYWAVAGVFGLGAPLVSGTIAGTVKGWLSEWGKEKRPRIPKEIAALML